jgi:hypothetical protein
MDSNPEPHGRLGACIKQRGFQILTALQKPRSGGVFYPVASNGRKNKATIGTTALSTTTAIINFSRGVICLGSGSGLLILIRVSFVYGSTTTLHLWAGGRRRLREEKEEGDYT